MRIVSHRMLKEFFETPAREDSKAALENWYHSAQEAAWTGLHDIRKDYPSADYAGNQHDVFNIRDNRYKLAVAIKFAMGYIFIRFVGTHKIPVQR